MLPTYQMYESVELPNFSKKFGTGWIPELPDLRDYTDQDADIPKMAEKLGITSTRTCPPKEDLRKWCSPIEDQGSLGSCTAQAGVGIIEYYQNRIHGRGKYINGSRLFVYKTTRNLLEWTGDTGAFVRTTAGALALCGVPPEKYWKYTTAKTASEGVERTFDDEPPAFIYALADNFEALRFFRHDPVGKKTDMVLSSLKTWLCRGIPTMLGFYGFDSFNDTSEKGGIPYPCPGERAKWGHAVVAVGYDDDFKIENTKCNKKTKGALLIRNSWGENWGNKGYGWLPYDYVLNQLARDCWSLISMEWIDTEQFGLR